VRIETGREIIVSPGADREAGVTPPWRVRPVADRQARPPMPRDISQDLRGRMRGRLVDILV